jgi:hypothetical protein
LRWCISCMSGCHLSLETPLSMEEIECFFLQFIKQEKENVKKRSTKEVCYQHEIS